MRTKQKKLQLTKKKLPRMRKRWLTLKKSLIRQQPMQKRKPMLRRKLMQKKLLRMQRH